MSLMQEHLRKYAEDGIVKKIRLTNLVNGYQEQIEKTKKHLIDQIGVIEESIEKERSKETEETLRQRQEVDVRLLEELERYLSGYMESEQELIQRLNLHMYELSEIEIDSGGFVTHALGVDDGTHLNKESMILTFKQDGHVEVAIGTYLNSWRDSSQMSINYKKGGV